MARAPVAQARTPQVLGLIPARGGSKGVPRKNARFLAGKPLIVHSIEVGLKCPSITDLCVSTDDAELAAIARAAGAQVPFMRPAELASDQAPTLPTMQHALEQMERLHGRHYEYLILLEPTSPLRHVEDVEGALAKLSASDADSCVGVERLMSHHPLFVKRIEGDRLVPFSIPEPQGTRRQDATPPAYARNGAVYVFRTATTTRQGKLYGASIVPWPMPDERSANIDREVDFLLAEALLNP
jgi:CMP-N,N'-diacetyllegionaminic acid synthase